MPKANPDLDALLSHLKPRSLNSALFNVALAYSEAGDMAVSRVSGNADFFAPTITCKAFSIELLLKFFVLIGHPPAQTKADLDAMNVSLHGHEYSKLYDRIPAPYRKKIVDSFSATSGQVTDERAFREILKSDLGDDPFVFWRYIYEKDGTHHFNLALLTTVTHALGKAAEIERQRIVASAP